MITLGEVTRSTRVPGHARTVTAAMVHGPGRRPGSCRASCSCGWSGVSRYTREQAEAEHTDHKRAILRAR